VKTKVNKYLATWLPPQDARKNTKNISLLSTKKAFTMIELIFVIIIIGTLAAIAIPRLNVSRLDAEALREFKHIVSVLDEAQQYFAVHGNAKFGFEGTYNSIAKKNGLRVEYDTYETFFSDSIYDPDSQSANYSSVNNYVNLGDGYACFIIGRGNYYSVVAGRIVPRYAVTLRYNGVSPSLRNALCNRVLDLLREKYPPNFDAMPDTHIIDYEYRNGMMGTY
jgi:transformation system protein